MEKDQSEPQGKGAKEHRPPNLTISKQLVPPNHKWRQCKIIGKNISIRSYSAACAFHNKIYLYGGYQILNGTLGDFYRIDLEDGLPTYHWEEILTKGKVYPGCRSKHVLLGGKDSIYLVGGLKGNNEASAEIFQYIPEAEEWTLINPKGIQLPPIESFSAVLVGKDDDERLIIGFGFNDQLSSPTNAIYEYHIKKNRLSLLFEGTTKASSQWPSPRMGCAMTTDGSTLFIFGGKDESCRLNDLWSFNLDTCKFTRLSDEGELPAVRNGHSLNYSDGKLYLFGGIHDITWELDDLHIYTLKNERWTTLEQDSPRKLQKKVEHLHDQKADKKKHKYEQAQSAYYPKSAHYIPSGRLHSPSPQLSTNINMEFSGGITDAPGHMLAEQRKRLFQIKKAEMLSNFQLSNQERKKLVALETASQAMRNSLDVIGIPEQPSHKLTDFGKQSVSHFLEPLQNNSNIVIGKRPCARDGHCAVVHNGQLIILGGDRHQMSFNDIYKLDLSMAGKALRESTSADPPLKTQ